MTPLVPQAETASRSARAGTRSAILLLVGVALWFAVDRADAGRRGRAVQYWQWGAVVALAAVCLVPGVSAHVAVAIERVRHPSARARRLTMLGVALASALYLGLTARQQHRPTFP